LSGAAATGGNDDNRNLTDTSVLND